MMNDVSRHEGSSMDLNDEIVSYLGVVSEIEEVDQLFAEFSQYSQGDICQVLITLCLQGKIVIEQNTIRVSSNNAAEGSRLGRDTPLDALGLRAPLKNRLENEGIRTIGQLTALSEIELLSIRGMGLKKLTEINEALNHWENISEEQRHFEALEVFGDSEKVNDVCQDPILLEEWVDSLSGNRKRVIGERLDGKTLQDIACSLDLTRERVRQIEKSALDARPSLEEDSYANLFIHYDFTERSFCAATKESVRVFNYLKMAFKKQAKDVTRKPLCELIDDDTVPSSIKETVLKGGVDDEYLYDDGVKVRINKEAILEHLLSLIPNQNAISITELLEKYTAFIFEYGIAERKGIDPTSLRAFDSCTQRYENMLSVPVSGSQQGRMIRLFDSSVDFEALKEVLRAHSHDDIECSADLLMQRADIAQVVEQMGLRNGFELHVVVGKYLQEIEGVKLKRIPMIGLGSFSREDQILDLIKEVGPVSAQDLSEAYERRYGMRADTFRGSCLKDFSTMLHDGVYQYRLSELDEPQQAFVVEVVNKKHGYMPIEELKKEFADRFPDSSLISINREALLRLGFRISDELVVSDDCDIAKEFSHLIAENDFFDAATPGLSPEVINNSEFVSELNKALRKFEVLEYQPKRYMNISVLKRSSGAFTEGDVLDYMRSAIDYMEQDVPYSIKSLRDVGFSHKLDSVGLELGLDNRFYESIIAQGYVGGAIKRTSMGSAMMFCKKIGWFSSVDVLQYVVSEGGKLSLESLQEALLEWFGVEVSLLMLKNMIRRSGLVYDRTTDLVRLPEDGPQ